MHYHRHHPPGSDDNCTGEQADSEHQGDPSAGGGAGGGTGGEKVDDLFTNSCKSFEEQKLCNSSWRTCATCATLNAYLKASSS